MRRGPSLQHSQAQLVGGLQVGDGERGCEVDVAQGAQVLVAEAQTLVRTRVAPAAQGEGRQPAQQH